MNAFPIRHRLAVIVISLMILGLAIIPLSRLQINADLESYMPESMQSKRNNRLIAEHFVNAENLLLVVDAGSEYGTNGKISSGDGILAPAMLEGLERMSDALEQLPAVVRVHSLFQTSNIRHEGGDMVIGPAIPFIPQVGAERAALRSLLLENGLAAGLVVSNDFRYALIMLEVERDSTNKNADSELIQQVREVYKDSFPGQVYLTGQAFLRDDANKKISRDLLVLLPIGLLVMFIFLWISFHDFKSVLLPFSIVIFSIIVSMALLPAFGWELSLIGILIPIMMIAIANNYGVHVIARYQELRNSNPQSDTTHLLSSTVRYLRKPVWLCGLTTMAGTLGLTAHLLIPARQMGIITALGIAFALTLSLTYLPAMMSYFTHKENPLRKEKRSVLTTLPGLPGKGITSRPLLPIVIAIVLLLAGIAGSFRLKVAPDSSRILPESHEFNRAIRIADEQFGGSKIIQVMIEGDAREPSLLKAIDSVSTSLERNPLVGHVASLATIIRKMHTGDSLPNTRESIAQYLELYGMSADIADYERFINFNYSHTLLTVQYRSAGLKEINALIQELETSLDKHNLKYITGGISLIDKEISESVLTGQISSLLVAFLAILVLLSLIFRSITAGLIGSIPLLFAVVCTFGFMGWTGLELDIVTALLSSISIGLGVDFTIHVFWRMKHELQLNGGDWKSAVMSTLTGTGKGITVNAFSVMTGFSVLLLSSFPFVQAFGLLIILSLFLCLISALIIVPALCLLLKPRFLIKH